MLDKGFSLAIKIADLTKTPIQMRGALIDVLYKYSMFLEENGYMDTDWRTESPYAIDEFLK